MVISSVMISKKKFLLKIISLSIKIRNKLFELLIIIQRVLEGGEPPFGNSLVRKHFFLRDGLLIFIFTKSLRSITVLLCFAQCVILALVLSQRSLSRTTTHGEQINVVWRHSSLVFDEKKNLSRREMATSKSARTYASGAKALLLENSLPEI